MSRRSLDETLTFVAAVDRAASPDAVADALLTVVQPFGFTQVLAGLIPVPGMSTPQQIANVVLHRWPDSWSQRYFSRGYLFGDPTIRRLTSSTDPFVWSDVEVTYRDSPVALRIMGDAAFRELLTGGLHDPRRHCRKHRRLSGGDRAGLPASPCRLCR